MNSSTKLAFLAAVALTMLGQPSVEAQSETGEPELVHQSPDEPYDGAQDKAELGYEYLDGDLVRTALEDVLSRPGFRRLLSDPEEADEPEESDLPEWLEAFADWLGSWLGPSDGEDGSSGGGFFFPGSGVLNLVVYGLAGVALLLLIAFIVRAIGGSIRSGKLPAQARGEETILRPDRAPGESSPAEYWQHALAYGERGDYRKALREILLAAMSTIERRGLIRFRKGLTNRDYFFALRGAPRESFAIIARAFELVYFGRREATAEAYRECRRAFEEGFRVEQPT